MIISLNVKNVNIDLDQANIILGYTEETGYNAVVTKKKRLHKGLVIDMKKIRERLTKYFNANMSIAVPGLHEMNGRTPSYREYRNWVSTRKYTIL